APPVRELARVVARSACVPSRRQSKGNWIGEVMFMRRCAFLLVVVGAAFLAFVLGPSRLVQASDDWLPVDTAELKMTAEPKAPGAPAIYLYRQVDRDDKGTASTEYNYLR